MRVVWVVVGVVGVVVVLGVGAVLYGVPAFYGWAFVVVTAGAAVQYELRRRGVSQWRDFEKRESFLQVLWSGSFLRFYPPLPTAIAFVVMAVVINTGLPALIMAPPAVVMMSAAAWERRTVSRRAAARRSEGGG